MTCGVLHIIRQGASKLIEVVIAMANPVMRRPVALLRGGHQVDPQIALSASLKARGAPIPVERPALLHLLDAGMEARGCRVSIQRRNFCPENFGENETGRDQMKTTASRVGRPQSRSGPTGAGARTSCA